MLMSANVNSSSSHIWIPRNNIKHPAWAQLETIWQSLAVAADDGAFRQWWWIRARKDDLRGIPIPVKFVGLLTSLKMRTTIVDTTKMA
jgi:hypothetical protein